VVIHICEDRKRILDATSHVLVVGGPGCGKTTIALRKALVRIEQGLGVGEKVLFLSFSRAAVTRIVHAARKDLSADVRKSLEIQTFHSFFWQLVRGHGYLLGAPRRIKLLLPQDERTRRNGATEDDPAWKVERDRLFQAEGLLTFDLFAPKALALLQGSIAIRSLLAGRYPLIIVDEAQDTGTDQWGCIATLASLVQLVCLADLEQQIYDFRPDVSPERLAEIMAALKPLRIDLGSQNNRSPDSEIVKFGNDVLANTPRGCRYKGVTQVSFQADAAIRDRAIRRAVGIVFGKSKSENKRAPESIGYLTNWGKGVAIVARALQGGNGDKEISHRVVIDEVDVLLATRVVASCLEPIVDINASVAMALTLLADLYRAKGRGPKGVQLQRNADAAREGRIDARAKAPRAIKIVLEEIHAEGLTGDPAQDWLSVRKKFAASQAGELVTVANLVVYLLAFNRGRRIADGLAEAWVRNGNYARAREIIGAAITEDQIIGAESSMSGINVMTMHKSKGKEFDCVIALHLGRISPYSPDRELAPHTKSRKLLRVAITRARHQVIMLTDAYSPSPLLIGHHLNRDRPRAP